MSSFFIVSIFEIVSLCCGRPPQNDKSNRGGTVMTKVTAVMYSNNNQNNDKYNST